MRECCRFRLAGIIPGWPDQELIINRGKDHGLAVGQFVMSPGDRGVVDRKRQRHRDHLRRGRQDGEDPALTAPRIQRLARSESVSIGNLTVPGDPGRPGQPHGQDLHWSSTSIQDHQRRSGVRAETAGPRRSRHRGEGRSVPGAIRTTRCSGTSRLSPSATWPACARWPSWSPPSRPDRQPAGSSVWDVESCFRGVVECVGFGLQYWCSWPRSCKPV